VSEVLASAACSTGGGVCHLQRQQETQHQEPQLQQAGLLPQVPQEGRHQSPKCLLQQRQGWEEQWKGQ